MLRIPETRIDIFEIPIFDWISVSKQICGSTFAKNYWRNSDFGSETKTNIGLRKVDSNAAIYWIRIKTYRTFNFYANWTDNVWLSKISTNRDVKVTKIQFLAQ